MISINNIQIFGWEAAIRGMRNPMNSWEKSDSPERTYMTTEGEVFVKKDFKVGPNDLKLMKKLVAAGSDHSKFMRMINVSIDITAPLYWWKEFDTYKVGTVANSCSTMHKIHDKEFTLDDFSHEHLGIRCKEALNNIIDILNIYRKMYVNYNENDFEIKGCPSKKTFWWQMIQLLPSSYNQKRTVQMNYETVRRMCFARKEHKLDEWQNFCKTMLSELPYFADLIGAENEK